MLVIASLPRCRCKKTLLESNVRNVFVESANVKKVWLGSDVEMLKWKDEKESKHGERDH